MEKKEVVEIAFKLFLHPRYSKIVARFARLREPKFVSRE
jgi:hypothetical protein